jgi:hypothetical protein
MGHVFIGCLRELCNTTFCIIEAGCYHLLNRLEGNKKSLMNILFINFCNIRFLLVFNLYFYNSPKEHRKAIREDPQIHDFLKRGVRARRNEIENVGFLGWPNEMCADTVELNMFHVSFAIMV